MASGPSKWNRTCIYVFGSIGRQIFRRCRGWCLWRRLRAPAGSRHPDLPPNSLSAQPKGPYHRRVGPVRAAKSPTLATNFNFPIVAVSCASSPDTNHSLMYLAWPGGRYRTGWFFVRGVAAIAVFSRIYQNLSEHFWA